MEHGFTFKWVAVGFGVVIAAKILASIITTKLGISL